MKKALITGITGQDGSYLAELLLSKNYEVHGIVRRSSSFNTQRINHIYQDQNTNADAALKLHYGDLADASSISSLISHIQPDEVYNLGAQSHVAVSFENPLYTSDINALGPLRFLEAIRMLEKECRFYQASSSELYGLVQEIPQTENTPFYPRSPYAVAKLFAYWITVNYRESYNLFAANGILFNHESPRRGMTFVTRKITRGLTRVLNGLEPTIFLGNMDALRDWGHAKDYVEMQWMILQHDKPNDYVIATGNQISVREFVKKACDYLELSIEFVGEGENEFVRVLEYNNSKYPAFNPKNNLIEVSKKYFRPAEVETLLGDSSFAQSELGWVPKYDVDMLITDMIDADLELAEQERFLAERS